MLVSFLLLKNLRFDINFFITNINKKYFVDSFRKNKVFLSQREEKEIN
jgi:hypothetical protein